VTGPPSVVQVPPTEYAVAFPDQTIGVAPIATTGALTTVKVAEAAALGFPARSVCVTERAKGPGASVVAQLQAPSALAEAVQRTAAPSWTTTVAPGLGAAGDRRLAATRAPAAGAVTIGGATTVSFQVVREAVPVPATFGLRGGDRDRRRVRDGRRGGEVERRGEDPEPQVVVVLFAPTVTVTVPSAEPQSPLTG